MPGADGAPLTTGQERLWFLDRLDPGDPAYNMPLVLRLRGPLDVAALRATLDALAERHEPLRARFVDVDGLPVQEILPAAPLPLERLDAPTAQAARELVAERTNAPFDLAAGRLIRAALLRLAPEDHVLCIVFHHIVSDGWSWGLLHDELLTGYAALRQGEPLPFAPLGVRYTDHARAQRAASDDAEALAYWRERLADPPVLDLPTDRPRPEVKTSPGAFVNRDAGAALTAARELARRYRCTPFVVLLAAYQVLLCRHAGQVDVCVGTPVAGRDAEELEPLFGYFSNTLVLRGDLSDDPTFAELLVRTRTSFVDALTYQNLPYERLIAELDLPRDLSRPPLFQTMLGLHDFGARSVDAPTGLVVEEFDPGAAHVKFDLALDIYAGAGEQKAVFCYNTDLFDAATIERLAERWDVLLAGALTDPDRPVSRLPLLAPGERERLLAWGDGGPVPAGSVPAGSVPAGSVPELVERAAARTPDAVAVVCGAQAVTYAELLGRADAIADALRAAGVRPGAVVGVDLPRSVDQLAALLGAWRAGAGYLPLDPVYPPPRRAAMAAPAAAVITPAGVVRGVGGVVADEPAYVIHTSGSTGAPKAVLVGHEALAARVAWMVTAYGLGPGDRVVQFAATTFDTHAEEVWPTLAAGATLVLLPDGPQALPDLLARTPGLTVLDLPTAYWHRLVDPATGDAVTWPEELRLVILGGEQVSGAAVAAWRERFHDRVRLVNTYGPTEATIVATSAELTGAAGDRRPLAGTTGHRPPAAGAGHRPPIGRPLAGTTAYVLDGAGTLAPPGTPGELYLGGAGLARGYLDQPELTAERFARTGFGRLYRTGDRVRWRPDGQLEFLGRLDDQVKVRGHRIEPGEVVARLTAHPGVAQAVVTAAADTLVAYVTGTVSPAEVRAWVAAALPAHLVPDVVVPLDELPLTRHGKVDVRRLPAPDRRRAGPVEFVPPRTDAEALVADVWSEVLDLEKVGALDDFFTIGGHSLHATRVAARLRAVLDVDVPIRTLFTHTTVTALATALEELLVADVRELSDDEASRRLDPRP